MSSAMPSGWQSTWTATENNDRPTFSSSTVQPQADIEPARVVWSRAAGGRADQRLDILAIDPHLIAQTILDCQDEAGDLMLSRDVLVTMLVDFRRGR